MIIYLEAGIITKTEVIRLRNLQARVLPYIVYLSSLGFRMISPVEDYKFRMRKITKFLLVETLFDQVNLYTLLA